MTKKIISVLIALYNHEKFIDASLKSALNQSLLPDDIVVIDDASTDNSVAIVQKIQHPSIRVFSEKMNLGGPNTMKGLALCQGDFVAILNSDDTWQEDKLQKQVTYLENHPNCGVVFTYVNLIDEDGIAWKDRSNRHHAIFQTKNRDRPSWLKHFFYFGNSFCASSALVRKECFDKLGLLDGRYTQLQDFDMWLRIAISGYDIHVIPEPLTNYRVMRNGSNMSETSLANVSLYSFEFSKILRNYWNIKSLSELKCIFPELPVSKDADDSLVLFYLAMFASKQSTVHHQLFALETMSHWGGAIHSMSIANKCHNFGFVDYRHFLSNGPIRDLLRKDVKRQLKTVINKFMPYRLREMLKAAINERKMS